MIIERIMTLLRRKKAAMELGVKFTRSATFKLPDTIHLNGEKQRLNLPDEESLKVAFIELLLDDCYGCRQPKKRHESIKTVLDIGANVGLFGIAARLAYPNATIHAYEPNPVLEPFLSAQAAVAKFEYYLEAVGSENGTISLDLREDSVHTRTVNAANDSVPCVAIREAIRRMGGEVDFLKMDCEGAEWDIFNDKESFRHVKHLAMEYHLFDERQTEQRVRAWIDELGFRLQKFQPIDNFGLLIATREA